MSVILAEPDTLDSTGAVVGILIGNSFVSGGDGIRWLGRKTPRPRLGKRQQWRLRIESRYVNPKVNSLREKPAADDAGQADAWAIRETYREQRAAPTDLLNR